MTPLDVSEAIERFANKLADEFERQATQAIHPASAAALQRAAGAAREAGKPVKAIKRNLA